MSEPQETTPARSTTVNEPAPLLRVPPDTGRDGAWRQPNVPEQYKISNRVFYHDPDAKEGQVAVVAGSVGFLIGHEKDWRFSVGVTIRTDDPNEAGHGGYSLAFGDVEDEAQALRLAEEAADVFLLHPELPPPPAPIPNLDLVAPAQTEQTQMNFIKRRMDTVRQFADHVHDPDFQMDEGMRATLARVADDMQYLIDAYETTLVFGLAAKDELDELRAALASGEGFDGFHTHNQLYVHRGLLLANLAQRWYAEGIPVVKSWRHHDGEPCMGGGWFIVVIQLVTGQISYHCPEQDWELYRVPHQELPPVWDGHTPQDTAQRLREAISLFPSNPKLTQRRCDNPDPHDPHPYSWSLVAWCASRRPNLEQG